MIIAMLGMMNKKFVKGKEFKGTYTVGTYSPGKLSVV